MSRSLDELFIESILSGTSSREDAIKVYSDFLKENDEGSLSQILLNLDKLIGVSLKVNLNFQIERRQEWAAPPDGGYSAGGHYVTTGLIFRVYWLAELISSITVDL